MEFEMKLKNAANVNKMDEKNYDSRVQFEFE